jgi:hypothetical protein
MIIVFVNTFGYLLMDEDPNNVNQAKKEISQNFDFSCDILFLIDIILNCIAQGVI